MYLIISRLLSADERHRKGCFRNNFIILFAIFIRHRTQLFHFTRQANFGDITL
jgi:hypothetical protein